VTVPGAMAFYLIYFGVVAAGVAAVLMAAAGFRGALRGLPGRWLAAWRYALTEWPLRKITGRWPADPVCIALLEQDCGMVPRPDPILDAVRCGRRSLNWAREQDGLAPVKLSVYVAPADAEAWKAEFEQIANSGRPPAALTPLGATCRHAFDESAAEAWRAEFRERTGFTRTDDAYWRAAAEKIGPPIPLLPSGDAGV
jgi:hypothetical protein